MFKEESIQEKFKRILNVGLKHAYPQDRFDWEINSIELNYQPTYPTYGNTWWGSSTTAYAGYTNYITMLTLGFKLKPWNYNLKISYDTNRRFRFFIDLLYKSLKSAETDVLTRGTTA